MIKLKKIEFINKENLKKSIFLFYFLRHYQDDEKLLLSCVQFLGGLHFLDLKSIRIIFFTINLSILISNI